jgi:MFS family permease
MAKIGGVVYLISAASALIAGMIVDRLITNSASPTRVMKTAQVGSMIGVAASMLICAVSGPTIAVGALCAWGVFYGVACNGAFAIGQTLAGPKAAGKWIGFQNFIANIAGIVGPIITGFIVDRTGQYLWAFVFTAAIALIGTIGWGVIVKRVEPVDWASANGSEH